MAVSINTFSHRWQEMISEDRDLPDPRSLAAFGYESRSTSDMEAFVNGIEVAIFLTPRSRFRLKFIS
jgi:hypothetical protein